MIDSVADRMFERATSVTLVIHGVGDHTPVDIAKEAKAGFDVAGLSASGSFCDLRSKKLQPRNQRAVLTYPTAESLRGFEIANSLWIRSGEASHFVIPLVWSHHRSRVSQTFGASITTNAASSDPSDFFTRFLQVLDVVTDVTATYNSVGLVGAVILAPLFLIVAVSVLLCLLLGLALFVVPFTPGFVIYSKYFRSEFLDNHPILSPILVDIVSFVPFVVLAAIFYRLLDRLSRALIAYDFLGDVAAYLGRRHEREQLHQLLTDTIKEIANRVPNASIVVVSHSLGTVLASHALAGLCSTIPGSRRVTLVTIGSPLRIMSFLFSRVVRTPDDLLRTLQTGGTINGWFNFWRDSDPIGRRLCGNSRPGIIEKSLGCGGHVNYWSDVRLWRELRTLLVYGLSAKADAQ